MARAGPGALGDEALPRITVVTPSFNQAQFLEETLQSVLDQNYPELEYIVLDAGSSDGSRAIIERYADRLTYWRSHPDDGQSAALREGFERATGDILTWLNSDDLLAPGALRVVADAWRDAGGGVMVAGACQLFDVRGPTSVHHPSFHQGRHGPHPMPLERIFDMARHWFPGEFFYQPEVFFPRTAYREVGGLDPSYYYTMDYDLWCRFALAGVPVVVVNDTLAWYREHEGQKTADKDALYREMVRTANSYLARSTLPAPTQRRLARLNRAALARPVREGWKVWLRARAKLGVT